MKNKDGSRRPSAVNKPPTIAVPENPRKFVERNEVGNSVSVKIDLKVLDKLRCHWVIKENGWRPNVRFGSTLTVCANRIYLFGGYAKNA